MSERRTVRMFEIGQRLFDRYEVFARYTGGMATVYGATDVQDGRRYAVKTCREQADQAALDKAFREEIALGLALEPHPGILRLRFAEALGDQLFAFFDFIDGSEAGRTLRDHIDAGAVTTALFGDYALQIARALEFLGRKRPIAHLDLKPSNILVGAGGMIRISDLGVSRAVARFDIDPTAAPGGTAGYMPPEQRDGRFVDERSDIYAFGVVLYEMLTGASPSIDGRTLYLRGFDPEDIQEPLRHELTEQQRESIGRLVGGCIDTKMSDRFRTFGDVARAITSIFGLSPMPAPTMDDVAMALRRAHSWQVIGEHSQCLRALNRLLVAHPDCTSAFDVATPSFSALAAHDPPAASPVASRAQPGPAQPVPSNREVFDQMLRCNAEHRYATALRYVFSALEARPEDESLLEFAAEIIKAGMGRDNVYQATPLGEQLNHDLISNPLIDPIFCHCTYEGCHREWVETKLEKRFASRTIMNSIGGECSTCGGVFCTDHFGHANVDVDFSRPVCPHDLTPLASVDRPNGRRSARAPRVTHPTKMIVLYREGPLQPDPSYAREIIRRFAPDALERGAQIRTHGVIGWDHIHARRDGLLAAYPPPSFEIETTPLVFEDDRIFIARVFERSTSGDNDVIQFPVDPPAGDPGVIERETARIRDVFRAHIARTRIECRGQPGMVYRCEQLLDARLLDSAARAALSCLQASRQTGTVASTGVLTEALALLVSSIAANEPARAKRGFPISYLATLTELVEETVQLPRGLDVAHWVLCGDDLLVAHLCYLPFDGAATGVSALIPAELVTESELQGVGESPSTSRQVPVRSPQRHDPDRLVDVARRSSSFDERVANQRFESYVVDVRGQYESKDEVIRVYVGLDENDWIGLVLFNKRLEVTVDDKNWGLLPNRFKRAFEAAPERSSTKGITYFLEHHLDGGWCSFNLVIDDARREGAPDLLTTFARALKNEALSRFVELIAPAVTDCRIALHFDEDQSLIKEIILKDVTPRDFRRLVEGQHPYVPLSRLDPKRFKTRIVATATLPNKRLASPWGWLVFVMVVVIGALAAFYLRSSGSQP